MLHPVSHLSTHCHKTELHSQEFCCIQFLICLHHHKTELHSQEFCCIQFLICLHTVTKQSYIHKRSAESSFSSVHILSQNKATFKRILRNLVSHLSTHCHKTELQSQEFCCIQFLICLHTVTKQSYIQKNSAENSFSSVFTLSQNSAKFTRILRNPVSQSSAHCHKTELHSQEFCGIQFLICLHTVTKQSYIHKNSAESSFSSVCTLSQNRATFTRILQNPVYHLSSHCHKTELHSQEFCGIQFLICLHTVTRQLHSQEFCCIQFLGCLHTVLKMSYIHKNSAKSSFSSVCESSQNRAKLENLM